MLPLKGAVCFMADKMTGGEMSEIQNNSSPQQTLKGAGGRLRVSDYNQKVFQLVVENVEDYAVFMVDLNGRNMSWNPGVEKLLGYQENDFIGEKASIIFTPEDISAGVPEWELKTALEEGRCEDVRWHVRKDGSQFWANGLMMLKDETEVVRGFVKIMRDHTAAKVFQEKLRQSEEKYRTLFNSIEEGFCVIEVLFDENEKPFDYRFLEINSAFERQTGIENPMGKTMREIAPQHEAHWFEVYGRVALTGEAAHFENRAAEFNRFYEVSAFRVGEPEERRVAVLFSDISERKKAEEEQKRLHELERTARAEAEAATKAKDEFISVVSHELRAPLHSILGWNEILKQHPTPEMVKKVTEIIERQSKQQVRLIEDLLDSAQIAAGNLSLNLETVDLIKIIASAVDNLRPVAANKGLQLNLELTSDSLPMTGDEQRLTQIIVNLLTNAIKFTPADGQITVKQHLEDTDVVITVKDSGKGINADFLPHVFERYAQEGGSSAKARGGGLGLGLSLVRHLVEMHGGTVTAASDGEGKGATFTVKFLIG